jgi:uncharacterized protein YbjQ (UPF0145 family)
MKTITSTAVNSANYITDWTGSIKNIFGGRLKNYEILIDKTTDEAIKGLYTKNKKVRNIKLQITEFTSGAISVTAYGEIQ